MVNIRGKATTKMVETTNQTRCMALRCLSRCKSRVLATELRQWRVSRRTPELCTRFGSREPNKSSIISRSQIVSKTTPCLWLFCILCVFVVQHDLPPRYCMFGILTNMYPWNDPNVGKYTTHTVSWPSWNILNHSYPFLWCVVKVEHHGFHQARERPSFQ